MKIDKYGASFTHENTLEWAENLSQQDWDRSSRNERTITIKGEEISTDLKDYKPPFDIKIEHIKDKTVIIKFCIGDFAFKNIAMESGKPYKFGRWGIYINSIDEKNKGYIIKIRELSS